jgi:predicted transcriptional regulator
MPRIGPNSEVFIYATSPVMRIVGSFTVDRVVRWQVGPLWQMVKDLGGVTRTEYDRYFEGSDFGVGIFIKNAVQLGSPISLETIRQVWSGFHPPQGFIYLSDEQLALIRQFQRRAA